MNIYDIARKAGVSIATVSRVINGTGPVSEKTRDRVTKVMEELGYTPNVFARGLMVNSIKVLGLLTIDVRDLYYASAIHTIEVEARQRGYDVILCSTGNDINQKKKYLKLLLQKRVDGIILVGSVFKEKTNNSHILEAARDVPVVMVNGDVEGDNIYSVICDDSFGIYSAVGHLVKNGRKDIVFINDVDTFSGIAKTKGFKNGMKEYGLNLKQDSIIKTTEGINGGYAAVEKLINEGKKISAIVAAQDILAVGVLKRLQEAGIKVPEDIAVIGYDNSLISCCTTPELTTVDSKVEAISSLAIKTLIDVIEGKNVPVKTVITPELVIRGTA